MIRLPRIILITTVIIFAAVLPAAAASTITWIEGSVSVTRGGRELPVEAGLPLEEGDRIATGTDSLAIIDLDGRGTLKLRSDTELVFESDDGDIAVGLLRGGLFSLLRRLGGRGYQVRTGTAVAAVRGTEFFVAYGRSVESVPDVWLCVNEGAVEVALDSGGDSVVVEEGEGINILSGNRISEPRYYSWTEDLNWNNDPAAGEVGDSTNLEGAYSDLRDFDYD